MTRYIPHTHEDEQRMLTDLAMSGLSDLFAEIPSDLMLREEPDLGPALSELELRKYFSNLADLNRSGQNAAVFMGAGSYDHYIPAAVSALAGRAEFSTAYTPYQAEISQGTLQAIFEFQTYICQLTGMDVSNASMYDGAMSLAEAVLMARAQTRKDHILVAGNIHPHYLAAVNSYCLPHGLELEICPVDEKSGQVDLEQFTALLRKETAALVLQVPSFHGIVEEQLQGIADRLHDQNSLLIVSWDPIASGLYRTPGEFGADIVTGEGQSLGQDMNFGGPNLGFIAVRKALTRRLPGRIVGITEDKAGNRAYVLTLQAREQHIRRDKATSNICTNQGLVALQAVVYLSFMGEQGLAEVARQCHAKSHYLFDQLTRSKAFTPRYTGSFFKEFVVRYKGNLRRLNERLLEVGIIGGLALSRMGEDDNSCLIAVTEKRSREEIDLFIKVANEVAEVGGAS